MRTITLLGMLACLSLAVFAKERQWQDAKVLDAKTGSAGSIAASSVSGTPYSATGLAVSSAIIVTYYTISTDTITYVVGCIPRGTIRYRCPDITVHGKTKIAIEGRDAHILDDEGKDRKIPILEKIANDPASLKPSGE